MRNTINRYSITIIMAPFIVCHPWLYTHTHTHPQLYTRTRCAHKPTHAHTHTRDTFNVSNDAGFASSGGHPIDRNVGPVGGGALSWRIRIRASWAIRDRVARGVRFTGINSSGNHPRPIGILPGATQLAKTRPKTPKPRRIQRPYGNRTRNIFIAQMER